MWFPFLFFSLWGFLFCAVLIYVRSSSAQVFYLSPLGRERSGGRHVQNIHVDTGEVRKAIGQPSQRQIWRVSLRIVLYVADYATCYLNRLFFFLLSRELFSSRTSNGGNFWFLLNELNKTLGLYLTGRVQLRQLFGLLSFMFLHFEWPWHSCWLYLCKVYIFQGRTIIIKEYNKPSTFHRRRRRKKKLNTSGGEMESCVTRHFLFCILVTSFSKNK